MKPRFLGKTIVLIVVVFIGSFGYAQLNPGIYTATEKDGAQFIKNQLTVSSDYIIHTTYRENPSEFVSTWGGFYSWSEDVIKVRLEFNSNYETDKITEKEFPFKKTGNHIMVGGKKTEYVKSQDLDQALDGFWLFGTRGPDTGQERRGDTRPRKTLKVLSDGTFQWIAYHTETFKFSGSGGGSYSAKDGIYTEHIEFFSRDNSRVGAALQFNYVLKGNDWHHTGQNSRGEPMYEIWSRR